MVSLVRMEPDCGMDVGVVLGQCHCLAAAIRVNADGHHLVNAVGKGAGQYLVKFDKFWEIQVNVGINQRFQSALSASSWGSRLQGFARNSIQCNPSRRGVAW